MFSKKIQIDFQAVGNGSACCVIDNVLADPDALVQFAARARAAFKPAQPDGDPGLELLMANAFTEKVNDFFRRNIRALFDARRTLDMRTKLAISTRAETPENAAQRVPHRFGTQLPPTQCFAKAELYLFHDESLGGTGFYRPKPAAVSATPDSFELMSVLPPRYNRMVFFDATLLHAAQLPPPEKLSTDPTNARLTLDGYFACRRNASPTANRLTR